MMRSLYSAVGGLRNHQTRMDVIGNNIANVNTTGYKGGRVNFQDILNQNIQGASGSQGNRGGTNPMQVGLGMASASIDTLFTNGSIQSTGVGTDLAISDAGFFILGEGNNRVYSRAGNFDFDNTGNYVSTSSGMKVMGWNATTGVVNSAGDVEAIKITKGQIMPASATTSVDYTKNLSADAATGTVVTMPLTVYDSLGNAHKVTTTFTKNATANTWDFATVTPTDTGFAVTGGTGTVTFNTNGSYNATTVTNIAFSPTGATAMSRAPDFTSLTQVAGTSTVAYEKTGYAAGTLDSVSLNKAGEVVGTFSNGQNQVLAQVALAAFNNPGGLTKLGSNTYSVSANSGEPQIGTAATGGRGSLTPGALEMSNVDLSQQFSDMIVTQRGFQSNSKIITVSDEMLETLVNMKR